MSGFKGVIQKIYKQNDYTLDEEVLNVLLHPAQHKLITAPAGGTKTTLTQLMVVLQKLKTLVDGTLHNMKVTNKLERVPTTIMKSRILCLVYNRHNVSDIDDVHTRMYRDVVSLKVMSADPNNKLYAEPGVTSSTMHGFALTVIEANLNRAKLRSTKTTKEETLNAVFRATVKKILEDNNSSLQGNEQYVKDVRQLYSLYVGLCLYKTPKDKPLTDSIQFELALSGMDIPSKYLREIYDLYDSRKARFKYFEYEDMLRKCDELLEHEDIRNYYKNYFEIIVADEVQDFTPLMFSIYRALVGENTKTITVGDPNQSIYSFLGAELNSISGFEDLMGFEPERFHLTVNRRCRKETMPFALNVLALNGVDKSSIVTNKIDGELQRFEYSNLAEQLQVIRQELRKRTRGKMGILFRTKDQSIMLSRYLYENRMSANYINAHSFNDHMFYVMFKELIRELFINKSQRGLVLLNRITTAGKKQLTDFLDIDPQSNLSKKCPESYLWHTLDFSPLYSSRDYHKSAQQFEFIKYVARESHSVIASDVIPTLLDMFYHNFYAHLPNTDKDEFLDGVRRWALEDFSTGYSLKNIVENLEASVRRYITKGRTLTNLNISTIHGNKGLECNHVILTIEEDAKAPSKRLSAEALITQEQEENRLFYVGATRQKDSLTLLVSTTNKHRLSDPKLMEGAATKITKPKFANVSLADLGEGLTVGSAPTVRSGRKRASLLEE